MNNNIPSRLYLDYYMAWELYVQMGKVYFIHFLENHRIITMDKECYDFLISIKKDYDKEK